MEHRPHHDEQPAPPLSALLPEAGALFVWSGVAEMDEKKYAEWVSTAGA